MNNYRRLSKDYEGHCHFSQGWMLWAMINRMLATLVAVSFLVLLVYQQKLPALN